MAKDLDGIITCWNAGAERIFGYMAEEIIGKPITILIPPDYQKEQEAIIERIRRGQRVEHFEIVRQRKDGASKIARDITDRKRSEAQSSISRTRPSTVQRTSWPPSDVSRTRIQKVAIGRAKQS